MTGDDVKKTVFGAVAGVALALGGSAAMADPVCAKAKLTGISAQHTLALPDGGVLPGWFGTGHGVAPDTRPGKSVEGDVGCSARTLGALESACFAEWKKAYCQ